MWQYSFTKKKKKRRGDRLASYPFSDHPTKEEVAINPYNTANKTKSCLFGNPEEFCQSGIKARRLFLGKRILEGKRG